MSDCGCEADEKRAGVDPAYRRALWIVVLLNLGISQNEVAAALVLSRFRNEGDATARAIWLFSRNDALANVAVIVAAGLVAVTGAAWPDLLVAGVIALLFLHSAYDIIRDALRELASHKPNEAAL